MRDRLVMLVGIPVETAAFIVLMGVTGYHPFWLQVMPTVVALAMCAYVSFVPPRPPSDRRLAREYDRARGYDRPLAVQAAEARADIAAWKRGVSG